MCIGYRKVQKIVRIKAMMGGESQKLWENRKLSVCHFSGPENFQARKLTAADSCFFPSCLFLGRLLRIAEEVNNIQFLFTVKILWKENPKIFNS